MAPNLILYMVFSFVPGFCETWPFSLNLWKLSPIKLDQKQQMKEVKQLGDKIVCGNETEIMEESPNESPFKPEFNLKLDIDQRPTS